MSKRTPKTTGSEWLYHSMNAFNGSGYADKSSPDKFVESYKFYKAWKKQKHAVELCRKFNLEAMTYAEHLVNAREPGHLPAQLNLDKFEAFKQRAEALL